MGDSPEVDGGYRKQSAPQRLNFTRSRGGQGTSRGNQDFEETKRTVSFQSSLVDLVEFLKNVSEGQT